MFDYDIKITGPRGSWFTFIRDALPAGWSAKRPIRDKGEATIPIVHLATGKVVSLRLGDRPVSELLVEQDGIVGAGMQAGAQELVEETMIEARALVAD